MIKTYLVRMKPLEPFTFGGEKGFGFGGEGNTSYYQTSKEQPEQTTILGMLRYIALENKGLRKEFTCYTEEDRDKIAQLVGRESFSFEKDTFEFGALKSVSPVFVVDGKTKESETSYHIRNPLCNLGEKNHSFMRMTEEEVVTSNGKIRLPVEEDYNTKTALKYGYVCIGSKEKTESRYVGSLTQKDSLPGNRKNGGLTDEDGFFRREVVYFKKEYKDFAFAVFVQCEENLLPHNTVAHMGLKKSAFMVTTTEVEQDDLEERIQKAFSTGDEWYYALSDMMPMDTIKTFSIVSKKQVRNLRTRIDQGSYQNVVRRDKIQYNLIAAGSVFYKEKPELQTNDNLEKVGYNCLIKIGGKN